MAEISTGETNDTPCCVVASCRFGNPDKIMKDLMKQDTLPDLETVIEDIVGCRWNFETKYYTCTVRLCQTDKPTLGDQQFANSLEAVILLFSPEQNESWTSVNCWLSYLEHLDSPVKLLVCDSCTDKSKIPRAKVQQWCIDNEFELIELDPDLLDDDEAEFEVEGIKRMTQVLYAHTWSNLVMKDKPNTVSPYMKQLMDESKEEQQKAASQSAANVNIHEEFGMNAEELNNVLNNDGEDGVESFEKLFSKLQVMKEKADSLPADQRKSYAENIAMSFWTAIGGSDEEINLSGDGD